MSVQNFTCLALPVLVIASRPEANIDFTQPHHDVLYSTKGDLDRRCIFLEVIFLRSISGPYISVALASRVCIMLVLEC
jgi:hypothetical protein